MISDPTRPQAPQGITFGSEDGFIPGEARNTGPQLPEDAGALVDISSPRMNTTVDGSSIVEGPNGMITVDLDTGAIGEGDEQQAPPEFGDNLAEHMLESDLSHIAGEIDEWIDADLASRKEWFDKLADGLELLGLTAQKDLQGIWKLADKLHHPVLNEAAVQFQARAISELIPAGGPAKAMVLGDRTEEKEQQGERVENYMNYQLMVEDKTYYRETDQMYFVLSLNGSQFKKVYKDPLTGKKVSRWVRGEYFVVPYGATSLEDASRYTHLIPTSQNDMKKLQYGGFYRTVALSTPSEGVPGNEKAREAQDKAQGKENTSKYLLDEEDHCAAECHCHYDLKGFEHKDDSGKPTGIALPYIITIEKESRTVLSIRRNYKEDDALMKKRLCFVHKPYLPGLGFYSYGLLHHLGGLAKSTNGLLKTIILGVAFACMQGGFKSKDARLPSDISLEFGKWKDCDLTSEEMAKCFWSPDFKVPPEAAFKVLEILLGAAERFGSTTESMVGDASNTGPVGTTVALIEQGSKVHSGIHKRLHAAQGEELQMLAELDGEDIPQEGYPYDVHGESRMVYATDFDGKIDIVPVSDPNIFSSTQRIAIAQSTAQRADEHPDLYDRRKVELRLLEAMRVPDPEDVLIQQAKVQRADPITENALMLVGKPAKVFVDQDHDAHYAVHQHQIDEFMAKPPDDPIAQKLLPIMFAHQAEHLAIGMRTKMAAMLGIDLPPLNLDADGNEPVSQMLPPQIENQIAQRAAMAIQKMPKPQQAGAGESQQLQKQAQALQQQAEALDEERKRVEQITNEAEKATMRAQFAAKETALKEQLATVRQAAAKAQMGHDAQRVYDDAVGRVEKLLKDAEAKKAAE